MRRATLALAIFALAASVAAPARALDSSVCGGDSSAVADARAYKGVFGSYLCNVYSYCQAQILPASSSGTPKNPRADWGAESKDWLYGSFDPSRYPEVKGGKEIAFLFPAYSPWKQPFDPREEYRSTQDKVYNCALWNAKSSAHQLALGIAGDSDAKFTKYVGNLEKKVSAKIDGAKCRKAGSASQPSAAGPVSNRVSAAFDANQDISKRLVGQSTMEYCAYRYYLEYLAAKFDDPSLFADILYASGSGVPTTLLPSYSTGSVSVVSMSSSARSAVGAEKSGLSRSYLAAVSAFSEFTRGYAAHLLLRLLERDYAVARAELDKMLTPVSQALYKAVNAMGSENTK